MSIDEVVSAIKQKGRHQKPILIAIEGYGGSGKSTLAEELKRILLGSGVIKIDSFIIKEKAQNAEPWEEVFDRRRLEQQVLKPASLSLTISYQRLDWANNKLGPNITLLSLEYLMIDGISSYHPDIEHYYGFKIWVDTPIDDAKNRGQLRDSGNENEKLWDRWAHCDLAYQQKYHPEQRADFIVSNN